jgi:TrmH family RNA methyltransferase
MRRGEETIQSRSNPHLKRLQTLKDKGDKETALVEGARLVQEALGAGILEAFFTEKAARNHPGLRRALEKKEVTIRSVGEALLARLSDLETSEGILAIAKRPRFLEEDLFPKPALLVVLCEIQNPGNVGGILRTAEAAGATGAILTRGTADPFSPKTLRGSMGSAFRLPHLFVKDAREAMDLVKARGVAAVATAASSSTPYDAFDWRTEAALFLGNEGRGLPEAVSFLAEASVAIPLAGGVESLNVAAAGAVLLFEAARQRRAVSR